MNREIANKIKSGMKNFLRPKQMEKLNEVLDSILAEQNGTTVSQKTEIEHVHPPRSATPMSSHRKNLRLFYSFFFRLCAYSSATAIIKS